MIETVRVWRSGIFRWSWKVVTDTHDHGWQRTRKRATERMEFYICWTCDRDR